MNVQFLSIRQPPYYRTLYNNKPHFYLQLKSLDYGRKSRRNYKLGRYHHHYSECSSRSIKTLIFIIFIMILFPIINLFL